MLTSACTRIAWVTYQEGKMTTWHQSISRFCIYVWTIKFMDVWVHGMNKIENILDKLAQSLNVQTVDVPTLL